jgi:hypothetical protein
VSVEVEIVPSLTLGRPQTQVPCPFESNSLCCCQNRNLVIGVDKSGAVFSQNSRKFLNNSIPVLFPEKGGNKQSAQKYISKQ